MAYRFSLNSMIRSYHEYSLVWNNPIEDEELACELTLGNSHNPYAVRDQSILFFSPIFLSSNSFFSFLLCSKFCLK